MSLCALGAGCGPKQVGSEGQNKGNEQVKADLVFLGGVVHTMDEAAPSATALAVRGERIAAVGSDDEVRSWIGEGTRVVNLEGRSLSPGLTDAHCHLYGLGRSLEAVNLRGVKSPEAAAEMVKAVTGERDPGEWITGRGWDQNLWEGQEFPNHAVLDAVSPENPVSLRRVDGHAVWANAKALELAGITDETPNPEGGKILRDDKGKATGVLIDMAMDLVEGKIPKDDKAAVRRRILLAAKTASAHGLTGVHEMGISDKVAEVYRELAAEGALPLRVNAYLGGGMERARQLPERTPELDAEGTSFFALRGLKLFADGALGSRGAVMLEPYSDDPENKGLWVTDPEELREAALTAASSGWQLAVHAIGDAGNRAVLDAFEAAKTKHPEADLRFRVEHAQILSSEDIPRFVALDVIASMQPTHATSDMPWAEARVGAARIHGAYAWRSIVDSGARFAGGSDFPVERVPPLLGLYSAVSRQDGEGSPEGGWLPDQRLTLEEALAAFTKGAAYAAFAEEARGILRLGYMADITVYDRALAADRSLLDTQIDMTVVGGVVRYQRESD